MSSYFSSCSTPSSSERRGDALLDPTRVTQLSWRPRAFLYMGFLSHQECDHLIALARDKLEKSMVADNDPDKSIMGEVRTSSSMFLTRNKMKLFLELSVGLPLGPSFQKILHYENGENMSHILIIFMTKLTSNLVDIGFLQYLCSCLMSKRVGDYLSKL
ncbi:prolyl 4-hydroxylase 2 precursor [Iris pallida]|uniref:Prolyl 4-hydroxylase 2 n=1 Tax=Iris pallida TaxID=29817 RepID=A0AAX6F5V0_IRIPA|nr:prolyl 4-hydroxylase 2 precursor [Iris pallida]